MPDARNIQRRPAHLARGVGGHDHHLAGKALVFAQQAGHVGVVAGRQKHALVARADGRMGEDVDRGLRQHGADVGGDVLVA